MNYFDAPELVYIGTSHKTASVALREKFALVGRNASQLTKEISGYSEVLEVVSVATCNRSELYLVTQAGRQTDSAVASVASAFAAFAGVESSEMSALITVLRGDDVVGHLMRVAAGVESVVVGEAQIQGQLKQALAAARDHDTSGPVLDKLFRTALETGKQVRTQTSIGRGNASIGSVAAELLDSRLNGLAGRTVTILGAGGMGMLALKSLRQRADLNLIVVNRDPLRAARVVEEHGGKSVRFTQLSDALVESDAVVACTNSPHAILRQGALESVVEQRSSRPLVLLDLAVPRDIEEGVGHLPGCHLYDLDDLEKTVARNLTDRSLELCRVDQIVSDRVDEFCEWHRTRDSVPAIRAIRRKVEHVRSGELERFMRRHSHLAAEDRRRIEQLTHSIINRVLHNPTVMIRESQCETVMRNALSLFGASVRDAQHIEDEAELTRK